MNVFTIPSEFPIPNNRSETAQFLGILKQSQDSFNSGAIPMQLADGSIPQNCNVMIERWDEIIAKYDGDTTISTTAERQEYAKDVAEAERLLGEIKRSCQSELTASGTRISSLEEDLNRLRGKNPGRGNTSSHGTGEEGKIPDEQVSELPSPAGLQEGATIMVESAIWVIQAGAWVLRGGPFADPAHP